MNKQALPISLLENALPREAIRKLCLKENYFDTQGREIVNFIQLIMFFNTIRTTMEYFEIHPRLPSSYLQN